MTRRINKLEATTVLTFRDNGRELCRAYDGLLNFQDGDRISLVGDQERLPVSLGSYSVRKADVQNQIGMAPDREDGVLEMAFEDLKDEIYRYFICEKID